MSLWGQVFAIVYDAYFIPMERGGLRDQRRRLLAGATGRTLEIGAGTGLNLPVYPPDVDLVLSEPEAPMARLLRRRVQKERPGAQVSDASADDLPFADASFDTVTSTLVLCTVPDQPRALAEVRRVLKPSGRLLFLEHVRSDSPRLARWQDRLHDPWHAFAYGCNCNLPTLDGIKAAGFEIETLETGNIPWALPIMRPVISGAARLQAG